MRFPTKSFFRALIVLSGFATLLLLGMDPKVGVVAVLAITAIDALSFLLPFASRMGRDGNDREDGSGLS
jgi:hypothetical protein